MNRSSTLPSRQPARAAVVLAVYLTAVAAVTGLLHVRLTGPLAALFSVMWALALLVPCAILAPRQPPTAADPVEFTPVLKRDRRSRDSSETTAPDEE